MLSGVLFLYSEETCLTFQKGRIIIKRNRLVGRKTERQETSK